jgi:hypothetical protein
MSGECKDKDSCAIETADAVETQSREHPAQRLEIEEQPNYPANCLVGASLKSKSGQMVTFPTIHTCPFRSHFESAGIL